MNKWLVIKTIIAVAILSVTYKLLNAWTPLIKTDVALTQLQDSDAAYANWVVFDQLTRYSWLLYVLILVITYFREIKLVIKHFTKKEGQ